MANKLIKYDKEDLKDLCNKMAEAWDPSVSTIEVAFKNPTIPRMIMLGKEVLYEGQHEERFHLRIFETLEQKGIPPAALSTNLNLKAKLGEEYSIVLRYYIMKNPKT